VNDAFEKKVRAAAVAGWWVVLVVLALLLIQYLAYLFLVPTRPAWLIAMWGPRVEWPFLENVWFWGIVAFKAIFWLLTLLALWLTLWARQLRNVDRE
jgi:Predicted metal-binding protein (DUF2103)